MTAAPPLTPACLAWAADGTPYSAAYDDIYHSSDGGLGQARHVFLDGNGLLGEQARWRGRERFVIVETGFGLGLNFLATWQAWRADPQRCQRLHFVSFEKHPFSSADLATLHARWPELAEFAAELQGAWPVLVPGAHRLGFDDDRVVLTLFFGDALEMLPKLRAHADAFYLDGFAPSKNADLWSPRIYSSLARLAVTGATLATWTVAGPVRKQLAAAGFLLEKRPGFGGKHEMTQGVFRVERQSPQRPGRRTAIVIGAGIAGCSVAERLAAHDWQITLIDRASAPAQGASGNHAGILRPLPSHDDNLLARLTRAAFLHTLRHLRRLASTPAGHTLRWDACGVLHLARDPQHEQNQRETVAMLQPPVDYLRYVDQTEASQLASWPVAQGGWWFPGGGWLRAASLCATNLHTQAERIRTLFGCRIARCVHENGEWRVLDGANNEVARAPVLVFANAGDAGELLAASRLVRLPLRIARGQVTHLAADALPAPDVVVCRLGYVTPVVDGIRSAGATFIADDPGSELRGADHRNNLARLDYSLPGASAQMAPQPKNPPTSPDEFGEFDGRVGFRCMTHDRLPLIGPLPRVMDDSRAPPTSLTDISREPGLYALIGLGSRGLVWASLAAELLAAQIEGEPLPLEADLVAAVDPGRFLMRRARRQIGAQAIAARALENGAD